MECVWSIRRPHRFVLQFKRLMIEYHTHCFYDYVQIGSTGRMCGRELPTDILVNQTTQVKFRSDGSIHAGGFEILILSRNPKGKFC